MDLVEFTNYLKHLLWFAYQGRIYTIIIGKSWELAVTLVADTMCKSKYYKTNIEDIGELNKENCIKLADKIIKEWRHDQEGKH